MSGTGFGRRHSAVGRESEGRWEKGYTQHLDECMKPRQEHCRRLSPLKHLSLGDPVPIPSHAIEEMLAMSQEPLSVSEMEEQ